MPIPRYTIGLISATALAFEILLVRIFSISQWHHFAYMIISLALLGYGVSGAFLGIFQQQLLKRFNSVFMVNLVLYGCALLMSYVLAQHTTFNSEEILWDPRQWLRLTLLYLYLAIPFFFAANAIGLALMHYHHRVSQIYGADLLGAGAGSLGVVILLFWLFPEQAVTLLACLALGSAWLAVIELRIQSALLRFGLPVIMLMPLLVPGSWLEARMSPYKSLSQTLQLSGARVIEELSSPLGMISVVESNRIPLRQAPGMSLMAQVEPPAQLGLFIDGDGPSAINHVTSADDPSLAYLDSLTWALPYHLHTPERVLILGAGGGSEVLQAKYFHAQEIDAVELNPQVVSLLRDTYSEYSGNLFNQENVNVITGEARGFLQSTQQSYDLIQVALIDSFAASSAGLYALSESYLYTVEALQKYLERLSPTGMLAISRWIKTPPRDTLKLFATAVSALEKQGITHPGQHLLLIRSWQTSTLLIKREPFTPQEILTMKRFCELRGFDTSYYPGIQPTDINRFNIMDNAPIYQGTQALLGNNSAQFIANYKFNLEPATDDQPYFFHFFKWQTLPEIISLFGQGGIPLLDTGYLVLVLTLAQAIVISLILILVPLGLLRRNTPARSPSRYRRHVFIYFAALGLAFLFLEIAFIQKFLLFLHHPLYAVSVVLTSFLLFAGAGSLYAQRLTQHSSQVVIPVACLILLSLGYLALLDDTFATLAHLSDGLRILVAIMLIAPLAFCMGIPFPMGIHHVGKNHAQLVPWAWGINGCASVISAVLATLLAMHFGFSVVVLIAAMLYALAALSFPA